MGLDSEEAAQLLHFLAIIILSRYFLYPFVKTFDLCHQFVVSGQILIERLTLQSREFNFPQPIYMLDCPFGPIIMVAMPKTESICLLFDIIEC